MEKIKYIAFDSWKDFKSEIFDELFTENIFVLGKYLFRGQGSSEWKLSSSFDRWFERYPSFNRIEKSKKIQEYFRKEIERLKDVDNVLLDDPEYMMALGQHSGLPTRLLDWSESPYVAAFFAFNEAFGSNTEELSDGNVAVWALLRDAEIWNSESGVAIKEVRSAENYRYRNQEGAFTINKTPSRTLEEYVALCEICPTVLWQFSIPISEAKIAMTDLAAMGLTHTRLFPDNDGCALAAKMRMAIELEF
jgi:FRG domain